MNVEALSAWIFRIMMTIAPNTPWAHTYESSAHTIAQVVTEDPLYPDTAEFVGHQRTAALLVALGLFEGSWKPDAEGDCAEKKTDGTCAKGGKPRSYCMFQIHESNHRALNVTKKELLENFETCTRKALILVRQSFRVCGDKRIEDRLAHYAAGGSGCGGPNGEGIMQSRHRMWKAKNLLGYP